MNKQKLSNRFSYRLEMRLKKLFNDCEIWGCFHLINKPKEKHSISYTLDREIDRWANTPKEREK